MEKEVRDRSNKKNQDICDGFCPSDADFDGLREKVLEVAGLSEIFKVLGDET